MADVIDVRDLPEEDIKFIQKLVEILKEKAKVKERKREAKHERDVVPGTHPSDVKGRLSRREIYDYL